MARRPPRPSPIAALALAAALAAASPGTAAATPPSLVFDDETCDLGSVAQGEQPDCVFGFANRGGETLHVLGVEPTCGCTTALLSGSTLGAGERGRISVVFDSDRFAGDVIKEVEVRTNDPARPLVTLRVKALVEPEIDFEPQTVTFDGARPGAALSQTVTLTNRKAEQVRILRLEAQPSSYRCLMPSWADRSHPLVIESWDRIAIDVRFSAPETLVMPVAGECLLEIDGPRKRAFSLRLLAHPAP